MFFRRREKYRTAERSDIVMRFRSMVWKSSTRADFISGDSSMGSITCSFHINGLKSLHLPLILKVILVIWLILCCFMQFNRDGVLLLRRLDSRLSKDLPSDLQKLRCKAAFEALKFSPRKDVWVITSCLTGLSSKYDEIARLEGIKRPELLTAKSSMTPNERKLAGLCPLNAKEVTRLLTIDYIVCKESDVFMASHGGNMGCAIQGHRAYEGHKKLITPNKRQMLPYFLNKTMTETESEKMMKKFHSQSLGQREIRVSKAGRDVTKYPVPECMCINNQTTHTI
ncbi:hypothetical protein HID58_059094 [Brassica napus]|uniref:O-fucosyltransferase family protein n=1 Tax=Brassica napus TaxID=3708 RepID=A0ABQ7ZSK5_BRANA|nr:hypothetical protein HID58_059094 [Brassica napus]